MELTIRYNYNIIIEERQMRAQVRLWESLCVWLHLTGKGEDACTMEKKDLRTDTNCRQKRGRTGKENGIT